MEMLLANIETPKCLFSTCFSEVFAQWLYFLHCNVLIFLVCESDQNNLILAMTLRPV